MILGLWWPALGIAAAGSLIVYFTVALVAHIRHEDLRHAGPPVIIFVLSAVSLVLHLVSM